MSSSEHPVSVCSGGHPAVHRVYEAMPVLVAVILAVAALVLLRARRRKSESG
jgi:hypothetical protein